MEKYRLKKYWYLAFLSVFGLPTLLLYVNGEVYHWHNFLWFLWLLDLIPTKQ